MLRLLLFFSLLLAGVSYAQKMPNGNTDLRFKLNGRPSISTRHWILNPTLDRKLSNRKVVVTLWKSSWLNDASTQHIESLTRELHHSVVQFVFLTDEEPKALKQALSTSELKTAVLTDTRSSTPFWNNQMDWPHPITVLIESDGRIKWIGHPSLLTKTVLQDWLNNSLVAYDLFENWR